MQGYKANKKIKLRAWQNQKEQVIVANAEKPCQYCQQV
jgi:hypothetical protein